MSPDRHAPAALIALIGGITMIESVGLPLGTPTRMGPGFFPLLLGGLLVACAAVMLIPPGGNKREQSSAPAVRMTRDDLRAWVLIAASVISFIVVGKRFGLAPAVFVSVFISAMAHGENSMSTSLILSSIVMIVSVFLFNYVLGISIPVFNTAW